MVTVLAIREVFHFENEGLHIQNGPYPQSTASFPRSSVVILSETDSGEQVLGRGTLDHQIPHWILCPTEWNMESTVI